LYVDEIRKTSICSVRKAADLVSSQLTEDSKEAPCVTDQPIDYLSYVATIQIEYALTNFCEKKCVDKAFSLYNMYFLGQDHKTAIGDQS
jgi:2-iminoacetate synthase ThiH